MPAIQLYEAYFYDTEKKSEKEEKLRSTFFVSKKIIRNINKHIITTALKEIKNVQTM